MYRKFFKNIIDFLAGLIALPFVLLFIIVFAPIIYFTDHGPVFYNAERVGKNGKIFKMYKFRSMKINSPHLLTKDGSTYNSADDPRVTKIGRFMRKTSIDEIPQFLNLLKGDMSLIGPRATLTTNFKGYEFLDDDKKCRNSVKPGITGYNQAYFRNSVTAEEKLHNDIYYVRNMSFLFDVKIIFKTVSTVLKNENIYVTTNTPKEL